MKKVVLTTILLTLTITTFWGQRAMQSNRGYFTTTGSYNWFVSAGAGIQFYLGNDDKAYMHMGNNVGAALDLAVGRWLTPSLGLRGHLSGLQGRGWSTVKSPYSYEEEFDGETGTIYKEKFFYTSVRADLLWSVLDIGNNYSYSRPIKIIPFLGVGIASTFFPKVEGMEAGVTGTAGIIFNLKIVDNISFNIEARSTLLNGNLDKVSTDSKNIESMNSLTVGLQFEINPKRFERRNALEQRYQSDIYALSRALAESQATNRQLSDRNVELNERCYQMIKDNELLLSASGLLDGKEDKPSSTKIEMAVFFASGSSTLTDMDKINLKFLSASINRNGGNFSVTPYADNSTGKKSDNMAIANKRGKAVLDYLVECGVKKDKLKVKVNEFNDVPFNTVTLNRCVIVSSEDLSNEA